MASKIGRIRQIFSSLRGQPIDSQVREIKSPPPHPTKDPSPRSKRYSDDVVLIKGGPPGSIAFQLPANPFGTPQPQRQFGSEQGKPEEPKWFPPGAAAHVCGADIADGMVYVGRNIGSNFNSYFTSCEIDEGLPIEFAEPNYSEKVGYYPSYERLTPKQRGFYIQWLAGGRVADYEDQWCLFLFLYGIEKRLLSEIDPTKGTDEILSLYREVDRLRLRFSHRHSFWQYAHRFLDLLDALLISLGVVPPERAAGTESLGVMRVPTLFELEAAAAAKHGLPISAEVALAIVRTHPASRLRTPARRCADEFNQLFLERYRHNFGDGILLSEISKEPLVVRYPPAARGPNWHSILFHNSALGTMDPRGGTLRLEFVAPAYYASEVTITIADLSPALEPNTLPGKLAALKTECEVALTKYSRYLITPNADPESEKARTLLPPELRYHHTPAASQVNLEVVADLLVADRVTAIMEELFADEVPVGPVQDHDSIPGQNAKSTSERPNLDSSHREFAGALSEKSSWSKAEATQLARTLGLEFLGLALSQINEVALDRTGSVLAEGEDPITVDPEIYKEMTE